MYILLVWRFRDRAVEMCMRGNQLSLALVPRLKNFSRRRAAEYARVD